MLVDYSISVIYDDFIYPNKALIGLKALATNQLSGSAPNLTFIKERATVLVYNPSVGYQEKDATNPAWAAYDYCHGARLLEDPRTGQNVIDVRGVPAELMMYDRFEEWAEHCDKMNLKINIEMATVGEFWQQVNTDIGSCWSWKNCAIRYQVWLYLGSCFAAGADVYDG